MNKNETLTLAKINKELKMVHKSVFELNDDLHTLLNNQKEIESLLKQLLKEYKAIRDFERQFKGKKKLE